MRAVFIYIFYFLMTYVTGLAAVTDTGRVYNPVYADTVLKNNTPPVDITKYPELNPTDLSAKSRYDIQPIVYRSFKTLVFVIFIISVLIFLLVKFLYPDYYAASVEGFLSLNFFNQTYRINEYGGNIPFLLMVLFRCLVISLGILLFWDTFQHNTWRGLEKLYYTVLLTIIAGTAVKNIVEFLFNYMAGTINLVRPYILQVNILYNVMCMFILPVLLVLFFVNNLQYNVVIVAGISWLTFSVLLYLIRSLQVLPAKSIISYLHFILYICAFEIIPWLLIARVIWNETNG